MVTWDKAYSLSQSLARKIKRSGFKPDLVIGIARGGLVPARIVCDFLLEKNLTSMKAEHWGVAFASGKAKIKYPLPAEVDIKGKRILIIDDVADTGETFFAILGYLKEKKAGDIRTAVLHYKTCSTFIPDYWGEKHNEWRWIIYPWALYEDMNGFMDCALLQPMTQEALRKSLKSNFNITVSRKELHELLNDMQLEGKFVKRKNGVKVIWERVKRNEHPNAYPCFR